MEELESIWAGLSAVAPRVDLWPVLSALGGPGRAPGARPEAWAEAGLEAKDWTCVARNATWRAPGIRAGGPGWPARLDGVQRGPVALCAEGDLALLGRKMVAIVGSRACTAYGRTHARRIAEAVVAAGGVVVSGLASGIDAEAHAAAGGATVAVLGQGLRASMPAWQARLRERLLDAGGLVLSEFPPDLPGDVWTFPVRNRIIAALADVVVVAEARARSGAKITAHHAMAWDRPLYVVPGPLDAPASAGCLELLDEGARVVLGPATVVSALDLRRPPEGIEARVWLALGLGATVEEVRARTGLSRDEVRVALDALMALGWFCGRRIRLGPGGAGSSAPRDLSF